MEIDDAVTQYPEDPPLWMGMGVETKGRWRVDRHIEKSKNDYQQS
jgi:hypothetical protein